MNTMSLLVNGRTAVEIAAMPEKQRSSITAISRPSPYASSSADFTTPARPGHVRRRSSRESPGWYNTDGGMTLDDFAQRLNTTTKRIERWQGACAQSVVMALMRPTPIALFVFNPVSLMIWVVLAIWYMASISSETLR